MIGKRFWDTIHDMINANKLNLTQLRVSNAGTNRT